MKLAAADHANATSIRLISAELANIFERRIDQTRGLGSQLEQLWRIAGQRTLGGKCVRPLLLLSTIDALDTSRHITRADTDAATRVSIAAAIELLHYSFLLHDDVIDGDVLRRGRPNLIGELLAERGVNIDSGAHPDVGVQRALHWARSCAILMGDLLLAEVHQIIARAELTTEHRNRALHLLDTAIAESVAGELLDVGMSDRIIAPDLGMILEMSRLKTATYSFELPLRLAAVLTDSSADTERVLGQAGRHLGLAFQLRDDMLSTFGEAALHGKDPFSDIREGKETALIAYARMTSHWGSIEHLFGAPTLSNDDALLVQRVLAECGAHAFVSSLIDDELSEFDQLLETSGDALPPPVRQSLRDHAALLAARTS